MTQQVINIGASEGDGTGDKARIFTDKINDNFTELYGVVQALHTPYEYGALGAGANDTTALAAWIASGRCTIPPDTYFTTTATLALPAGGVLIGSGRSGRIVGSSVSGPILDMGVGTPYNVHKNSIVRDIGLDGTATSAFRVRGVTESVIQNIFANFSTGSFTDGFILGTSDTDGGIFSSRIGGLYTNGAAITGKCFSVGTQFNANEVGLLYTSNTNAAYNFFFEAGISRAHGSTFNGMAAQGGYVGLYLGGEYKGHTINGFYAENVVNPIVLGSYSGAKICSGVTFNGATIGQPSGGHTGYAQRLAQIDFNYARGIVFNSPHFDVTGIASRSAVSFSGGGGSGATAVSLVSLAGAVINVVITNTGSGYTSAPTVAFAGAGSGATATVTVSGGRIASVTITAAGSGYDSRVVPVIYTRASRCVINYPDIQTNVSGSDVFNSSLWPYICKSSTATAESGIEINGDTISEASATSAHMRKISGDAYTHGVFFRDVDGVEIFKEVIPVTFS